MNALLAICARCRHYRTWQAAEFSALGDWRVLKAKMERDRNDDQRRLLEEQRFQSGEPFDYEPHFYAWCNAFTPYDEQLVGDVQALLAGGEDAAARDLATAATARNRALFEQAGRQDLDAIRALRERGAIRGHSEGAITPIYALCERVNPEWRCALFVPQEQERKRQEPDHDAEVRRH